MMAKKIISKSDRNKLNFSPKSRESWHGRPNKGGESLSSQRLAAKLRDFHKFAKIDAESNKELDQWNETLRNEVMKLCQENGFNTGFLKGSDSNSCTDAYELKVRLEHILERISLICKAANTEKPSMIEDNLFIGGGLAARSVYTLQHLGFYQFFLRKVKVGDFIPIFRCQCFLLATHLHEKSFGVRGEI